MGGIPRFRWWRVVEPHPVMMSNHGGSFAVGRPVLAGSLMCCAIWQRAGQDVMTVRCVSSSVDRSTLLVQGGFLRDFVLIAVKLLDAGSDHLALGVDLICPHGRVRLEC